jgi:hypothetical protein
MNEKQNKGLIMAHKVLAIFCFIAYLLWGLLMISGAVIYSEGLFKNIFVGLLSISWGMLIRYRERAVLRMINPGKNFLISDFILLSVIALVALIFIVATIFRLFVDHCAVFD